MDKLDRKIECIFIGKGSCDSCGECEKTIEEDLGRKIDIGSKEEVDKLSRNELYNLLT